MFQASFGKKSWQERRNFMHLSGFIVLVVMLFIAGLAYDSWAYDDDDAIPFDEAEVFFELNNTDGDLGIHSSIDGEPWKRLEIEGPRGRKMLNIFVQGRLRRQGLTQLFFESAEPTFDELNPKKFFRRFPEGEYEVEGVTLDHREMESTTMVTHLLPAPPEGIIVNDQEIPGECDDAPVNVGSGPVTIGWDPVGFSHPELGRINEPIEIVQYQVVVENEDTGLIFSVELPPDVTEVDLPAKFTESGGEFKLEILVREESHNQTATETCFEVE